MKIDIVKNIDVSNAITRKQVLKCLEYAILAPSNLNSQPWKFYIKNNEIFFYPNYDRWDKFLDKDQMEMFISLGCCVENFIIAANYYGYKANVLYAENFIRVVLEENLHYRNITLFKKMEKRSTFRGVFSQKKIELDFILKLQDANIRIFLSEEKKLLEKIDTLVCEADIYRFSSLSFQQRYIYSTSHRSFTKHGKKSDRFLHQHNIFKQVAHNAPVFGFFYSEENSKNIWMRAGRVLEKLYLHALEREIYIKPQSNILEVEKTKHKLYQIFNKKYILQTFYIGYPQEKQSLPGSFRYPLTSFLLSSKNI